MEGRFAMRRSIVNAVLAGLALLAVSSLPSPGRGAGEAAATLVMIEETGCPYCRRWHAQVGPAYHASPEGRFAPLLRMDIGAPERRAFADVRFTPTFILVKGRDEIGRIVGYPGEDFFWSMLGNLLAKAGFVAGAPADQRRPADGGARTEAPPGTASALAALAACSGEPAWGADCGAGR